MKKLRHDSNELLILQYLHSFAPSHNYVLPLLAALELDGGTFIFLPEATPLELGFTYKMFCNNGADFSRQLIEGVVADGEDARESRKRGKASGKEAQLCRHEEEGKRRRRLSGL